MYPNRRIPTMDPYSHPEAMKELADSSIYA